MAIPLRATAAALSIAGAVATLQSPANASDAHPAGGAIHTRAPIIQHQAAPQAAQLRLRALQDRVRARRAALIAAWTSRAQRAVRFAYGQRGAPYVWGGTGPRGYDCSGLVQRSWQRAGVSIPRIAADQFHRIRPHVSRGELRPGDLVFFHGLSHVGIYIGRGRFIHSPHTGTVVQIATLSGYYGRDLVGAARPAWPRLPAIPSHL